MPADKTDDVVESAHELGRSGRALVCCRIPCDSLTPGGVYSTVGEKREFFQESSEMTSPFPVEKGL